MSQAKAIADYLDDLAEKQDTAEARRALEVAAANVRAGLFEFTGAAGAKSPAVITKASGAKSSGGVR